LISRERTFVEQFNPIPLLRTKMELQLLIQQTPYVRFNLMAPKHGNACFKHEIECDSKRFYIACCCIKPDLVLEYKNLD
jgi:hypothetical protein